MSEGQIKINPYAVSPRRAIGLMADICSGRPSVNVEKERLGLEELIRKNFDKDWVARNIPNLGNSLLFNELSKALERLSFAVANDFFGNYKRVRVALTGITSSGKSSLINFLMKRPDLLPVDPDPSTILPTHIYCTNRNTETKAYAINHRNALIQIDLNAISGIQHSNAPSKSMERGLVEQISYSMSRFVVECPHYNFNDIEFIDTPGFNANDADDVAAMRSLENCDVVLFLVDTANGDTGKKDIEILKLIKKPVLLVANCNNKMMTRGAVVDAFSKICESVNNFENILDCVCISSKEPDKYGFFSRSGVESMDVFEFMVDSIKLLASQVASHTEIDYIISDIRQLLKDEAKFQNTRKHTLEQDRTEIANYITSKFSTEYIRQKSVSEEVCEAVALLSRENPVLKEDDFYERFCFLKDYYINSEKKERDRHPKLFELFTKKIEHCVDIQTRLNRLHNDIMNWYDSQKKELGTDRVIATARRHPAVSESPFMAVDNVYDFELEGLVEVLSTEEGFDVINTYNDSGYSLLTYTAFRGNVPALHLVISGLGKDRLVRKTDREGRNILHAAAQGGNVSLFNALKEKFPQLKSKKDKKGRVPEELLP